MNPLTALLTAAALARLRVRVHATQAGEPRSRSTWAPCPVRCRRSSAGPACTARSRRRPGRSSPSCSCGNCRAFGDRDLPPRGVRARRSPGPPRREGRAGHEASHRRVRRGVHRRDAAPYWLGAWCRWSTWCSPRSAALAFFGYALVGLRESSGDRWARKLFRASMPHLVLVMTAFVLSAH